MCTRNMKINSLPTWEGITRQMDPPLACLSNISGKHHILRMETGWFSNNLFKKSKYDCREGAQLWWCITSLVLLNLNWLAKFKVFSVWPTRAIYWHGEMFKYQEFSGSAKPIIPAALSKTLVPAEGSEWLNKIQRSDSWRSTSPTPPGCHKVTSPSWGPMSHFFRTQAEHLMQQEKSVKYSHVTNPTAFSAVDKGLQA